MHVDLDEQTKDSNFYRVESVANIVVVSELINSEPFLETHVVETDKVYIDVTEEELQPGQHT